MCIMPFYNGYISQTELYLDATDVINDNGLNVTDISSKQDVNYMYFCDATATYTWIDHCLSTSHDIAFDCKIVP